MTLHSERLPWKASAAAEMVEILKSAEPFSFMSRNTRLFSPFRLRNIEFRNRIFVSPMCQYSALDGMPTDWHFVHLGSRAVGGAGMVMMEATAVSPEGRISPGDCGIWTDAHATAYARIADFITRNGAVPAIQLAHAGRKASTSVPWEGDAPLSPENGAWEPLGPSALAFAERYPVPREMTHDDIEAVIQNFVEAAKRALHAGFRVVELHMAHGYLMHAFLSPLSNHRSDEYGGKFDNRCRLPLAVARAVRANWPNELPLFVRISATDWAEGGWDLPECVELAKLLKASGVDLIDCSSGGLVPHAKILPGPGYQLPFAAAIRAGAQVPTGAVGFITDAMQAESVLVSGQADAVFLGREMLRDPYWPLRAAKKLGAEATWPAQYLRAGD